MEKTLAPKYRRSRRTTDPQVPEAEAIEPLLRTIESRLRKHYGTPRLGNPTDPLDDLVFVLLSGRTHARVHERIYQELKDSFPSWNDALQAGSEAILEVIQRGGLGKKKAEQIYKILLVLAEHFSSPTLLPLKGIPDAAVELFLTSLPGVGLKTARCVMLYTLERKVFPVDVHTIRILGYFGLINPKVRTEFAQGPLQEVVPLEIRYSLHVNLVAHGRETCIPIRPLCDCCPLNDICPAFQSSL